MSLALSGRHRLLRRLYGDARRLILVRQQSTAAVEARAEAPTSPADEIRSLFADVDAERVRGGVEGAFAGGKFRFLMRNVIATPSNLMAAYNAIKRRSGPLPPDEARQLAADGITPEAIQQMCRELAVGIFDVKANCVELEVSNKRSSSRTLVLPNLKLKIAMEATRMALQEVYEPRFSNFSFAHRPGRGRHMALRFVKYRWKFLTWFIRLKLKQKFLTQNMDVLTAILEETVDDSRLISFLQQLFRNRVLQLDMGEAHLGDFSKEPLLSPILMNIYLDKLDSKINELALGVASMNQDEDLPAAASPAAAAAAASVEDDIGIVEDGPPVKRQGLLDMADESKPRFKVYACRYADELLLAVTGQKEIALTVQHEACIYLSEKLIVEVDKGRGALQEAGRSTVDFLGFVLQFVPPSGMPGYKKQTTIQAMRKVQNRVEEVKRQQKEHWEATMRKLGGRMLVEIFRRARRNEKSAEQADETVRRMFESVAGDVVRGFLSSPDEKQYTSERFKKGHVLLSPWIRQQIPKELTDAYDRFQEQLDIFLGDLEYTVDCPDISLRLKKRYEVDQGPALKLVEQREDELRLIMTMPEQELLNKLRSRELVDAGGFGLHMNMLVNQEDIAIIQWYAGLAKRWLDYYRCSDNFAYVKKTIDYQLRHSMLCTLAAKHKCTTRNIKKQFSPDIKVLGLDGSMASYFPTASDLRNIGKKFLCPPQFCEDTKVGDGVLFLVFTRMSRAFLKGRCCAMIGCYSGMLDQYLTRVHKLKKRVYSEEDDWVEVVRVGTLHSVYDYKSVPLCFEHYLELLSGRASVSNVRAEAWVIPIGKEGRGLPALQRKNQM